MPRARDEFGRITPIQKYGKAWVDRFDKEWEDACFPFLQLKGGRTDDGEQQIGSGSESKAE